MVLAGYNVQEIIDKNTYKGLQIKVKIHHLEKGMSNGTKVQKRDGRIESLDLDKMHLMVEEVHVMDLGVSA